MSYFFVLIFAFSLLIFRLFLTRMCNYDGFWDCVKSVPSSLSDLVFYRRFARMPNARRFALIDCRRWGLFCEFAVRYSERYGFYYCLSEFVVFCSG